MSDTTRAASGDGAEKVRDVDNLTVLVDPGTLVRTPDGRVWCRQEPDIGGWEIVPIAVVTKLAEAETLNAMFRHVLKAAHAVMERQQQHLPADDAWRAFDEALKSTCGVRQFGEPKESAGWEPLDDDDAMESLGGAVHTGLRKGTEAPEAHELWMAIRDGEDAWPDAVMYAVRTLKEYAGIQLCRKVSTGNLPDASGEGD